MPNFAKKNYNLKKKDLINHKEFLKNSLIAAGEIFMAPLIESCKYDGPANPDPDDLKEVGFRSGVASFDPTPSGVIIWTRYSAGMDVEIIWEISREKNFSEVVRKGKAKMGSETDFTIAVDVQDIPSNTSYYYRFYNLATKEVSAVGETLTLPAKTDQVSEVRMAMVSCANYSTGLFNVYGAIAVTQADVVVHLGIKYMNLHLGSMVQPLHE